jgi:uncharacterized protein YjbI with pentapeptide repeats
MPSLTRLARDVAANIWPVVRTRSKQGWEWLRLRPKIVFWAGGLSIAFAFLVFSGPTAAGAALLAWAALRQAATANDRHQEQTHADRQRRIIESFSKAIEQLGSDKLEVRLGGIYALERISQESPQDYWTVMENLTAFVRERTQRTDAQRTVKPLEQLIAERAYLLWESAGRPEGHSEEFWREAAYWTPEIYGEPPATDIAAVLTVIQRRVEGDRALEAQDERVLDFREAVLRRADLTRAHLEGAILARAHLEGAMLVGVHFEGAGLMGANLEGALLYDAHLERADLRAARLQDASLHEAHLEGAWLTGTHLEGARLSAAHLERANFDGAHLEGASLVGANLEGANLRGAEGLTQTQIDAAFGDTRTQLPEGLSRPAHWTKPANDGAALAV